MDKVKPWEPFEQKTQELWKKYITGKKFRNLEFNGSFKEGRPVFIYTSGIFGESEVIFRQYHREAPRGYIGYFMYGRRCSSMGRCPQSRGIDKYFEQIYQSLLFLNPFPYSSIPNKVKKFMFLLILVSKKLKIPFEILCHISSFLRVCEIHQPLP